jgi:hypothetical protein
MNKYENGKIYVLSVGPYFYLGSSICPLNVRLSVHKQDSKSRNSKLYRKINEIGWDNVSIELIEDYPCTDKMALELREVFYILQHLNDPYCLNTNRAYVDAHEALETNRRACKRYNARRKEIRDAKLKSIPVV